MYVYCVYVQTKQLLRNCQFNLILWVLKEVLNTDTCSLITRVELSAFWLDKWAPQYCRLLKSSWLVIYRDISLIYLVTAWHKAGKNVRCIITSVDAAFNYKCLFDRRQNENSARRVNRWTFSCFIARLQSHK